MTETLETQPRHKPATPLHATPSLTRLTLWLCTTKNTTVSFGQTFSLGISTQRTRGKNLAIHSTKRCYLQGLSFYIQRKPYHRISICDRSKNSKYFPKWFFKGAWFQKNSFERWQVGNNLAERFSKLRSVLGFINVVLWKFFLQLAGQIFDQRCRR